MQLVEGHEADTSLAREVSSILADYFEDDIPSPTDAAISRGRAKLIVRDAANDDEPLIAATA